jgi:hypothetical protein
MSFQEYGPNSIRQVDVIWFPPSPVEFPGGNTSSSFKVTCIGVPRFHNWTLRFDSYLWNQSTKSFPWELMKSLILFLVRYRLRNFQGCNYHCSFLFIRLNISRSFNKYLFGYIRDSFCLVTILFLCTLLVIVVFGDALIR